MSNDSTKTDSPVRQLKRFLPYLTTQSGRVVVAYSVSLLGVLLALLLPWPLKFMIDGVLTSSGELAPLSGYTDQQQIVILSLCLALVAALAALTQAADKVLHAKIREQFSLGLRDDLVQRLYRISREKRQAEMSGELTMRLVGDAQLVSRMFCKVIPMALKHIVTALAALIYIFLINPIIGTASLVMASALGFLVAGFGPQMARAAKAKRQHEGSVSALTQETISGVEHIQAMALEDQSRKRYLGYAAASLAAGVDEVRTAVRLERSSQLLAGASLALVAGIGGVFVVRGQLTIGALTVCLAYIAQLLKPIEKINEIAKSISRGIARAQRIDSLFELTTAPRSGPASVLTENIETIQCDGLTYQYESNDAVTISNFSMQFRVGECTALVGPSGCGKSTLLRLILGLQAPTAGRMSVNGHSYNDIDTRALRRQFAVMLQDAHLFAGSIRDVVTEVNSSATDQMVNDVLRAVHMQHVVEQFRAGLDTRIDEAGARLSAGQRARLLLARALLSQRPVLILDEPFANLDDESRRIILQCLVDAKKDRLIIVVTHERELLEIADRVLTPTDFQSLESEEIDVPTVAEVSRANAVA